LAPSLNTDRSFSFSAERSTLRAHPNSRAALDPAGVNYIRADFGSVQGKVQICEINTNPEIIFEVDHPSTVRWETYRIFKRARDPSRVIDPSDDDRPVAII
jgi:hypothetical protein